MNKQNESVASQSNSDDSRVLKHKEMKYKKFNHKEVKYKKLKHKQLKYKKLAHKKIEYKALKDIAECFGSDVAFL